MSTEKKYEPEYQIWKEKDFWADRDVVRMTPLQRHLYRGLLQAMYYADTRPYLPADDEKLWVLADADDLDQWLANKAPVLRKFIPHTGDDGEKLLKHKRVLADWGKVLDWIEKQRQAGKARHRTSATAERSLAGAVKTETVTKTVLETVKQKHNMETETDAAQPDSSMMDYGKSASSSSSIPTHTAGVRASAVPGREGTTVAGELSQTFSGLFGCESDPADLDLIIERHYRCDEGQARAEIPGILHWAANTSTYWGSEVLTGSRVLLTSFKELRRQWELYMVKARAGLEKKTAAQRWRIKPGVERETKPEPDDDEIDNGVDISTFELPEDELA